MHTPNLSYVLIFKLVFLNIMTELGLDLIFFGHLKIISVYGQKMTEKINPASHNCVQLPTKELHNTFCLMMRQN